MKKKELIQLKLFESPKTENDFLWEAISSLRESQNSVRKRLFQEIENLKISLVETKAKNARLEAFLNCSQLELVSEMIP